MVELSITSISSAQADGQSCGQVECRMSTFACWFMGLWVTSKAGRAERNYPARRCVNCERAMHYGRETAPPAALRRLEAQERHDHRHAAAKGSISPRPEFDGEEAPPHPSLPPFPKRDQDNAAPGRPCRNRNPRCKQ